MLPRMSANTTDPDLGPADDSLDDEEDDAGSTIYYVPRVDAPAPGLQPPPTAAPPPPAVPGSEQPLQPISPARSDDD